MIRGTYLKNLFELVFPPSVSRAMYNELNELDKTTGVEPTETTLAAQTTFELDFSTNPFQAIVTGSQNITLTANIAGLKPGQRVFLRFTQGATARTVTWGTGIKSDVTVTATGARTDMLVGVFDGTRIMLGALAQNLTL